MVNANQYYFDPEGNQAYAMGYQPDMASYGAPVMHPGMPRSLSATDLSQFPYRPGAPQGGIPMGLLPAHQITPGGYQQPHPAAMYNQHGVPLVGSPPASPNLYDPLSPPVSGSDTSGGEGFYNPGVSTGHHSRTNSGATSPAHSRRNSLVHRNSLRYNPTPSPSTSSGRRSRGQSISDDEGMGPMGESFGSNRKEATRKQRIEAEQRRRDELRDGYAKLKDVLPASNSKSIKVSLLERATKHIVDLERRNDEMQARLSALHAEVRHLRSLNEKISLAHGITPASPAASVSMSTPGAPTATTPEGVRTMATPPGLEEGHLSKGALASVSGQETPKSDSSGSDGDL